jgi:hypothetical protein
MRPAKFCSAPPSRKSCVNTSSVILCSHGRGTCSISNDIKLTRNIVHAVKADPTEGENSPLYAAMGYVRASDRSSGLTRTRAAPAAV